MKSRKTGASTCSVPSHDISSMWRTYGHCDCFRRLQQHLSLATNERFPPETNPHAGHRAPKNTGNIGFVQLVALRILCSSLSVLYQTLFFCQVSVVQYGVNPKFEFKLNDYKTKEDVLRAASGITQMYGGSTNTFHAIEFAKLVSTSSICFIITWLLIEINCGLQSLFKSLVNRWDITEVCVCVLSSVSGVSIIWMELDRALPRWWWSSLMESLMTKTSGTRSLENVIKKTSPALVSL